LALGHFLHELIKIVVGEVGADPAETPSYLFANCSLTEGVEFCKCGIDVDLLF
jgi:hypothetical protein